VDICLGLNEDKHELLAPGIELFGLADQATENLSAEADGLVARVDGVAGQTLEVEENPLDHVGARLQQDVEQVAEDDCEGLVQLR
jgi:hypothetical protein